MTQTAEKVRYIHFERYVGWWLVTSSLDGVRPLSIVKMRISETEAERLCEDGVPVR